MAYIAPTPESLVQRYPAFAGVSEDTIAYWLNEAASECISWPDESRRIAETAYAAHRMAELGAVSGGSMPEGVTNFRSADFSASIAESVAGRTGFDATVYGREFAQLRRRAFAGPRPSWTPPYDV